MQSPTLFLQLVQLTSLLTQLVGQPEVFTPGLSTNRLWLIIKAVECYWTFCRSLHLFQRISKRENKDWIMVAYTRGSKSQVSYLKAQKQTQTYLPGGSWIKKMLLWSLNLRLLLQCCELVSVLRLLLLPDLLLRCLHLPNLNPNCLGMIASQLCSWLCLIELVIKLGSHALSD